MCHLFRPHVLLPNVPMQAISFRCTPICVSRQIEDDFSPAATLFVLTQYVTRDASLPQEYTSLTGAVWAEPRLPCSTSPRHALAHAHATLLYDVFPLHLPCMSFTCEGSFHEDRNLHVEFFMCSQLYVSTVGTITGNAQGKTHCQGGEKKDGPEGKTWPCTDGLPTHGVPDRLPCPAGHMQRSVRGGPGKRL